VSVDEAVFVEVFVNSKREEGTNAKGRGEGVGSRSEMSDGSEVFHTVSFFLEWVIAGRSSDNGNGGCFEFKRLFCSRGGNEVSCDGEGTRDSEFADFFKIR
jgi:hypothetical protein